MVTLCISLLLMKLFHFYLIISLGIGASIVTFVFVSLSFHFQFYNNIIIIFYNYYFIWNGSFNCHFKLENSFLLFFYHYFIIMINSFIITKKGGVSFRRIGGGGVYLLSILEACVSVGRLLLPMGREFYAYEIVLISAITCTRIIRACIVLQSLPFSYSSFLLFEAKPRFLL